MLQNRLIPVLTIDDTSLVKTIKFKNPRYVGDPLNAVKIFNEKEVDELMFLDITASKNNKEPNFSLIKDISGECLMPLTYGGGVSNLEQARKIFSLGVEKICIQSAAINNPKFLTEIVDNFGSQSVILSIDLKRDFLNKPRIYNYIKGKKLRQKWIEFIKSFVDLGIGELLINSVDNDGMMNGPDLEIISTVRNETNIPIISLGGVSSMQDIKRLIQSGASAVAAGSFFTFYGPHKAVLLTYPDYDQIKNLFKN